MSYVNYVYTTLTVGSFILCSKKKRLDLLYEIFMLNMFDVLLSTILSE